MKLLEFVNRLVENILADVERFVEIAANADEE